MSAWEQLRHRTFALLCALAVLLWAATGLSAPGVITTPEPPAQSTPAELPPDAPVASGVALPEVPDGFNTHDGGWIRFAYPRGSREVVQPLIDEADRVRAMLSDRLGTPVLAGKDGARVHVRIARTAGEMSNLAPEGVPYPRYASGVAYSQLGLVLLTMQPVHPGSQHDLAEVFRHELAHVALYDAVGGHHVPRWFNEGFAVHVSGEGQLARLQTLWSATLSDSFVPLAKIDRSFPGESYKVSIAYAQSADVVRYLVRTREQHRFHSLLKRVRDGQGFESALRDAYGVDLVGLEHEWREDVAKRYSFWPVFFSGTVIWVGAIGLFAWGWRRRRRRAKETLQRWEKEEAEEDARLAEARAAVQRERVRIVISRNPSFLQAYPSGESSEEESEEIAGMKLPERITSEPKDVPKVEHEGEWHTLH